MHKELVRHILIFGLLGGLLIALLKWIEYRWLVVSHSIEIYGALVAAVFAIFGIWLGLKITKPRLVLQEVPVPAAPDFVRDEAKLVELGLTPRELEILEQIALGLSNREIGERLFVSENTVKTHSNRVFDKLGVSRRTQAVQRAREWRLIP